MTCTEMAKEKEVVKQGGVEGNGDAGQAAIGKAGKILYGPWIRIWVLGFLSQVCLEATGGERKGG